MNTLLTLWTWLPFLLEGFLKNVNIALAAMLVGTVLGSGLALLKLSERKSIQWTVGGITSFFRNVPTLVILFYLATLLPNELVFFDLWSLSLSPAMKASLALASSPIGFTAWNLNAAILNWRKGDHQAAMLFVPNWVGAFIVTTMASSVASLVGVDELVGRSNSVINATSPELMIPVYGLAMLIFFTFCYCFSELVNKAKHIIEGRKSLTH